MQEKLIKAAKQARKSAYAPYSNFKVGAALLTTSGEIFTGSNIENAAYPVTCCAERVAIFKAISEGFSDFEAIAVVADTKEAVSPCGSCRQVMSEFFQKHTSIFLSNLQDRTITLTIEELLPYSFHKENLIDK